MTRRALRHSGQRLRSRRGERGVAMFVVMAMVIMVTAAGVFVSRSSSLEIRSAGYLRQAVQTHYINEGGASATLSRMRMNCPAYFTAYLRLRALQNLVPAQECPPVVTSRGNVTPPCYNFLLNDLDLAASPNRVFASATGVGTARTEGSFGISGIQPHVFVRVTEVGADTSPQRGMDMSDPSLQALPMRFLFESTGTTQQESSGYGADNSNSARGSEQLRAIAVMRCN
ncbi:MAG: hypothetical protein JNK72_08040 [Myxococcales bacterium]|nr:hypothetical protein [Myxococcales bacterium]